MAMPKLFRWVRIRLRGVSTTSSMPGLAEHSVPLDYAKGEGKDQNSSRAENVENLEEVRVAGAAPATAQKPEPAWTAAPIRAAPPVLNFGPTGHRAWLCQKLVEGGADSVGDALADHELLEMLIFISNPKDDTKQLAKDAIRHFGSFARVLTASTRELFAWPAFDSRTVAAIRLVQASAVRLVRAEIVSRPIFSDWDRLIDYLNAVAGHEKIEQFRVLFLDSRNGLIADELQARGTVNHTPAYPREIIKRALELHATSLILAHNHPSGDPMPSDEDITLTREIRKAAATMSIVLHDHIIIGKGRWTSLQKARLL